MAATINAEASRIWDEAEAYIADPSKDISEITPSDTTTDLDDAWEFVGLLDAGAGIPWSPSITVDKFDGFGHPGYRYKASKGELKTGFTALEDNSVTRKFVMRGSDDDHIGIPTAPRFHVMYIRRDESIITSIVVTTKPALLELSSHSGSVEGAQESYEITCHHAGDDSNDAFKRIEDDNSVPTSP